MACRSSYVLAAYDKVKESFPSLTLKTYSFFIPIPKLKNFYQHIENYTFYYVLDINTS